MTGLACIAILAPQVDAGELKLIHLYGQPVVDREKAFGGRVRFASWIDENAVVFTPAKDTIVRLSLSNGKSDWVVKSRKRIEDWSYSRKSKRLAYRAGRRVCVLDCSTGGKLFDADDKAIARLLGVDNINPSHIALSPVNGQLFLCESTFSFGRNGYVLGTKYRKVVSSFSVDAYPRDLTLSPDGKCVAVIGYRDLLSVRNIRRDCDVFLDGKRVVIDAKALYDPKTMTTTFPLFETKFDTPFFSHIRYDGKGTIIYSQDGGWGTGKVFVRSICGNKAMKIDGRNGHIEMDVDFKRKRIVLTGTSTDLTVVDFAGKELFHAKAVTKQRNLCVEFSPSGKKVLVGSWDNTLSIFSIE